MTLQFLLGLALTLFGMPTLHAEVAEEQLTTVEYVVADWVVPISPSQSFADELMMRVREKVAPDSWYEAGGRGTMSYDAKRFVLTVRQTATVHGHVRSFIDALTRQPVSLEVRVDVAARLQRA